MIITKSKPYTKEEIENLAEEFGNYIKTVIDIEKEVCSAGANLHFESEQELIKQGSNQKNLWGGGIDLEVKIIDNNAMINLRPNDNNFSNEIQDSSKRQKFGQLMEYFFKEILK